MKHFSLIVLGVFAASSAAFAEDQVTATAKGAAVQHRAAVSQAQHQRAMNSPTVRQLTNTQHVPVSRSARYNNAGVPSRMYRSNGDHVYTGNSQYRGNWNGQRANTGVVNSGVAAETNAAVVANTNGSRYTNRGGQWNGYAARGGGNWARTSNWDRSHHDRGWYRSHYSRFATFGGGYYYWDNGFWFPAYGYDPYFSTYSYDAPIYAYQDQDPGQVIANVQGALQQQGFYHGAVDGTYGPETRRALLNFQRQNGLPESGQIDQDTLGALGMQ